MAYRVGDGTVADCRFCQGNFIITTVLYSDEDVIAVENIRSSGTAHWLLMPLKHIRDIEGLGKEHIPILRKLDKLKGTLLSRYYPHLPRDKAYSGYHRGRRPTGVGTFQFPDIISVHHLHLHIIIEPSWFAQYLKYPSWFPWMWVTDEWVLRRLEGGGVVGGRVVVEEEKRGEQEGGGKGNVVEGPERRINWVLAIGALAASWGISKWLLSV